MAIYLALGLLILILGVAVTWYVLTRNVEIARYDVLEADGDIEIRAYPALVVAEVIRAGNRDEAVRAGFGPLARYTFAKERPGERIAMTAPVTQTSQGGSWTIQFIMPSGYDINLLPRPSGTDVRLRKLPPARRAAIRFSGWWSDDLFKAKDAALLGWLGKKGLSPAGPPTFAYYNDPFTPGFLRRNEILYELEPQETFGAFRPALFPRQQDIPEWFNAPHASHNRRPLQGFSRGEHRHIVADALRHCHGRRVVGPHDADCRFGPRCHPDAGNGQP